MRQLTTAAHVARELVRLGRGSLGRTPPVDAATLTRLLGRRVDTVTPLDGTSGTTDRRRLAVTGEDGVPASLFVKTQARDAGTRLFGGLARLAEVECAFYAELRPRLRIPAPTALAAELDRRNGRFVVVLEDLAAAGATFVDTLTPLTADQAAGLMTTLARLHAATAEPTGRRWLRTNADDPLLSLVCRALPRLTRKVKDRDATLVVPGGETLLASYADWAHLLERGPQCVLHGDPHPGNLFLRPTATGEEVGLLDWQCVRRGTGLRDVAYSLVLGLPTELRRTHERDLLDHYRAEVARHSIPLLPADDVWDSYRRMVAYPYVAATFTSGLGGLQGGEIADEGLRRAAAAVVDLGTVAAVTSA